MNPSPTQQVEDRSTAPAGTFREAVLRVSREPSFLVALVVLLAAAVGLNAAVGMMKLHFKKEPVALVRELGVIPSRLGPWVQVSLDKALDKEVQDQLGTDKYIFRDYVDTRIAGEIEGLKDMSEPDRMRKIAEIRQRAPEAVVHLSVTYYTGMVDTVAHVPDRCVTASGFEPKAYDTVNWPMASGLPPEARENGDDVEVRHILFQDQVGSREVTQNISYFFHANGQFMSSPLKVRQKLGELWVKKGYYAKIETLSTLEQKEAASERMTDFLTFALPEIYKCLPDWAVETGAKPAAAVAQR